MRTLGVALVFLVPFSLYASARSTSGGLAERVAELEAQVEAMEEILQFVRVETEEINNLAGPHWIIEGANVHVQSGSGRTADGCEVFSWDDLNCDDLTGLGNLIIGYNEPAWYGIDPPRSGSHNLILGQEHAYTSFSGLVAGWRNWISGPSASVSGGTLNIAFGHGSSVSGGQYNNVYGVASSISGGLSNDTNGSFSSVSGGFRNVANGPQSSVSGGNRNDASGQQSWIGGGKANGAIGLWSSVSGGGSNEAVGQWSSVSGGQKRTAPDYFNWVAGSLFEEN